MKFIITCLLILYASLVLGQQLIQKTSNYPGLKKTLAKYHVLKKKKKIKHGEYTVFNKDGSRNVSGWYNMDRKDSLWNFYGPDERVMIEGQYQNNLKNGEWKYYRENGVIESVGMFSNNKEVGHWEFFNENGVLICEGEFDKGDEVEGSFKYYDINGNVLDSLEVLNNQVTPPVCRTTDDINAFLFDIPTKVYFRLGKDALSYHIGYNILSLPMGNRDNFKSGTARVIFLVKPNGKIDIIKFVGSFSEAYDQAMEKLLLSMPKWIPSTKDGNPVNAVHIQQYSHRREVYY